MDELGKAARMLIDEAQRIAIAADASGDPPSSAQLDAAQKSVDRIQVLPFAEPGRQAGRKEVWVINGELEMQIEIEYCGQWNYEPRAREAANLIRKKRPDALVTLLRSGGGTFEIRIDGKVAFSKRATGRFPTDDEVVGVVPAA